MPKRSNTGAWNRVGVSVGVTVGVGGGKLSQRVCNRAEVLSSLSSWRYCVVVE